MEIKVMREGLQTYCVAEAPEDAYFLEIEYHILRENTPKSFLPVQIREEDGKKRLLYLITGKQRLTEAADKREFRYEDGVRLLESLSGLLADIGDYMLELDHVCFLPEEIYESKEGLQWIYCPGKRADAEKEIEEFFSWLLSKIDYENQDTVALFYSVYGRIRRESLSEEVIRRSLVHAEGMRGTGSRKEEPSGETGIMAGTTSSADCAETDFGTGVCGERDWGSGQGSSMGSDWGSGRGSNTESDWGSGRGSSTESGWESGQSVRRERYPESLGERKTREKAEQRKGRSAEKLPSPLLLAAEIVLAVLFCLEGAVFFLLMAMGARNGFSPYCVRYSLAIVVLLVVTVFGVFRIHAKRKGEDVPPGEEAEGYGREDPWGWASGGGEEEGTMVLGGGDGGALARPVLQSLKTGELFLVCRFPWRVGSEASANDMVIEDKAVSRRHAVIGEEEGRYVIKDMSSTNGTFVDKKKVQAGTPEPLRDGCTVRFAGEKYRFFVQGTGLVP